MRARNAWMMGLILAVAASAGGQGVTLERTLQSPEPGASGLFGASIAGIPDVDGDGVADILIGAHGESPDGSPINSGRAHLYSGATGNFIRTLKSPSESTNGYFGYTVGGVGDIDGDGFGDIIVCAQREEVGDAPEDSGRVHLFSGATGALIRSLESPNREQSGLFGFTAIGIPDVTGDGVPDMVVGAPFENPGLSPTNAGRAYIFNGATGGLVRALQSANEEEGGAFGIALGSVPDVTGDGVDDILVSAREEDPGAAPDGAGRVYLFNGATGALLRTFQSPNQEIGGRFGYSVSGVPDITGDGRGEVIIGADQEDPGSSPSEAGRAYIFNGSTGALISTLSSPNEQSNGRFGHVVLGVADVSGNGRGDVIVTALAEDAGPTNLNSGRAYIFNGVSGQVIQTITSPTPDNSGTFGWSAAVVPTNMPDGPRRIVIGARNENPAPLPLDAGQAHVYQAEQNLLKPMATFTAVTTPRRTIVSTVTITFNEPISGFDIGDLRLTRDGNPVILTGVGINGGPEVFTITGLGNVTTQAGSYVLRLVAEGSGIIDSLGATIETDATLDFQYYDVSATIVPLHPQTTNRTLLCWEVTLTAPIGTVPGSTSRTATTLDPLDIELIGTYAGYASLRIEPKEVLDGSTAFTSAVHRVFVHLGEPAQPGDTVGISITGTVAYQSQSLAVPVDSPLTTLNVLLADKNGDGIVDEIELNQAVLEYRGLLP